MTRKEQMQLLVDEFKLSGLSRNGFSRAKNINYGTFKYWHNKLDSKPAPEKSNFVKVVAIAKSTPQKLEIEYPNGVKLRLDYSGDIAAIGQLINLG